TESSGSVTVDTTAPVTTDHISPTWSDSTVVVTLICTDTAGSGCATTYYTTDKYDTPTTGSPTGTTISLSVPGTYTIKYFSVDLAGNTELVKHATNTVKIETSAPTGGNISYTSGYQTTTSVALTVDDGTDTDSGINTSSRVTQRKSATLSAGTCGSFGSFAPITPTGTYPNLVDSTVLNSNCYQYEYQVFDNAHNQATYTSANIVKIDTGAPTGGDISYTSGYQTTASVALTVDDGTDAISGVDTSSRITKRKSTTLSAGTCGSYGSFATITPTGTYPNLTDSTVASGNCYQYEYLVSDTEGNQATYTSSSVVKIDTSSPVTTDNTDSSWHNTSVTITLSCTDTAGSGCATTYYTTNGDVPTTDSSSGTTISLASTGTYTIKYFSVDLAGNTELVKTATNTVKIDTGAPTTPGTPSTTTPTKSTSQTWTFTAATDAVSGIANYLWRTTGTAITSGTSAVNSIATSLTQGIYNFFVRGVDNAGNQGSESTSTLTVDTSGPTISNIVINTTASTTIATISYDTNEIGTSQIEYGLDTTYGTAAIDPDALTPSTAHAASFSPLKPCTTYHYRATSVDQLGNTGLSVDNTFITSGCTASAPVVSDVAENATTVAGGSLSLLDSESKGIALTIPPLYAVADANFQAHQLDKVTVLAQTSVPTSYTSVGNYIYELEALTATDTLISTFDIPLTISIAYGSSDVSSIEEPTLTIWSWDGATWTQLSDCLVDTVAQTVTCSTSHFSVFALFGIAKVVVPSTNTSSSSSSQPSVAGPSSCEKSKPTSVTDLFQINVNKTTAQLFFTSVSDADNYFFSFATTPKGEEHGTSAYLAREGVQNYTINYLKPNTTYYFKVRANNGCMGGDWSQILKVKTLSRETTKPAIYYKGKNILTSVVNPIITGIQKVFIPSKTKSTTPSATATPTNVNTFNQTPVPTVAPTQTINSPEPVVVNQVKTKHCFLWWCW
ncbi:MAG: chitobiase/beta-hexosaminidase C-terminal domain-containing protein, partial [bacterium]